MTCSKHQTEPNHSFSSIPTSLKLLRAGFTLLTSLFFLSPSLAYDFAGGTGTEHDPYQIATAGQLIAMGSDPNLMDKHYVLLNDIDLDPNLPDSRVFARAVIAPLIISPDGDFNHLRFRGHFDGNGFEIRNLTVSGEGYLGLFGVIEKDAQVMDLGVVHVQVTGSAHSSGSLAGHNKGTLSYCRASGTVSGHKTVGGLVGFNRGGTLTDNCHFDGAVSGEERVGGLVGMNYRDSSVIDCHSSAAVSGQGEIGGLIGANNSGARVIGCHSTGTISGVEVSSDTGSPFGGPTFGGLIGSNGGTVANCFSHSTVSNASIAGGLVGENSMAGSVSNCYSTGGVFGAATAGGLLGRNLGDVNNAYSTGKVSGDGTVGGLIGYHTSAWGYAGNCFWDIDTSGLAKSGAGSGLITELMQDIQTFLAAGWDFVGESQNGFNETWQMPVEGGYPTLSPSAQTLAGRGTPDDPYLILTEIELAAVNRNPTAAFKLMANLDLKNTRWLTAVVPRFAGRFNGNGFVVSNLTIDGSDDLGYASDKQQNLGLFGTLAESAEVHDLGVVDVNITNSGNAGGCTGGIVGLNDEGRVFNCFSSGMLSGRQKVGGIVGKNKEGSVSCCFSTTTVSGIAEIGGIVGRNGWGDVSNCYSAGAAWGNFAGGIVGANTGGVTHCYSTSAISGAYAPGLGGLVAHVEAPDSPSWFGDKTEEMMVVTHSFWDIESSGQTESQGGVGLTGDLMQDISTYLEDGWGIIYHPVNSPDDLWWMPERGTPRLWWQYGYAYSPDPVHRARYVSRESILQWSPGGPDLEQELYFGDDEALVANATRESLDVYCGPLAAGIDTYDPGVLEWGKTYYWRINGINEVDPHGPWQGEVWSFATVDSMPVLTVDDFESYDDHCNRIFFTWQDGYGHSGGEKIDACNAPPYDGNGSNALVGNADPPFAEQVLVHEGAQSLPIDYDNEMWPPWLSEAQRSWSTPLDWTIDAADALVLYFRGKAENTQDPLYIAVEDSRGDIAVLVHSDARAVHATEWRQWRIALNDLDAAGIDVTAVRKMVIGVGDRDNPQSGGKGRIYIDDIQLIKRMP